MYNKADTIALLNEIFFALHLGEEYDMIAERMPGGGL